MGHTKNPDFTQIFYDYGWMIGYDMQSAYDWSKIDEYNSGVTNRLDETIEEIGEYINLCKDKGIELIIFINPYCAEEFRKDLENGYKEFLEKLANLHPYYNFCGINEYTVNHDLFIDPSHYNAYLGDEILDVLTGVGKADGDTGWGMYVTTDNIKKFFDVLVPEEMVSVH